MGAPGSLESLCGSRSRVLAWSTPFFTPSRLLIPPRFPTQALILVQGEVPAPPLGLSAVGSGLGALQVSCGSKLHLTSALTSLPWMSAQAGPGTPEHRGVGCCRPGPHSFPWGGRATRAQPAGSQGLSPSVPARAIKGADGLPNGPKRTERGKRLTSDCRPKG